MAPAFEELPRQSAPWLRSVVGAPKGSKPKASSKRGAHLNSVRANSTRNDASGSAASSSAAAVAVVEDTLGVPVATAQDGDSANSALADHVEELPQAIRTSKRGCA